MKTIFINNENDFHKGYAPEIMDFRRFTRYLTRGGEPMDETLYDRIGGSETIGRLVDAFYGRVQEHPQLSKLFPEDIRPVRNKQFKFLTQFFGGPHLYSDLYGAPMLRFKHLPHPISPMRAIEWVSCMTGAIDEIGIPEPARSYMLERLSMTAQHMVNSPEESEDS